MVRVYSWNVNGMRAIVKSGFLTWLAQERPDLVCIQETKAKSEDLDPAVRDPKGYASVWQPAERPGYSGVAVYYKKNREPLDIQPMGVKDFDCEGRVQVITLEELTVVNAYFPNSQPERARLDYKLAFCTGVRKLCNRLRRKGKHVALCGDYNIAHKEIDLARPAANVNNPGFYPEERAAMDTLLRAGYVDTFRHFTKEPGHYTWWSYRTNARARNIGWRLDYFCVDKPFLPRIARAEIHSEVMGSDHCPVSITVR